MKPSVRLLPLLLHFVFLIPGVNGQSWEVVFEDIFVPQSYNHFIFPGANNSVRFSGSYPVISNPEPVFSFDETGALTGQTTVLGPANWRLVNVDKSGASYWMYFHQLKKLNADNQVEWTYNAPINGGTAWEQILPNGTTCLAYYEAGITPTMDLIDKDGHSISRFQFLTFSGKGYYPGQDNSLIYARVDTSTDLVHWVKKNQFNQEVWNIDLGLYDRFLSGSLQDGSTYYISGNILIKLDATGNLEWTHDMVSYFPNSDGIEYLGFLNRADGSVVLAINNFEATTFQYTPHFVNFDLQTGDLTWITHVATKMEYAQLDAPLIEMSDGGILACFSGLASDLQVLLVRTDLNGNTIANQIEDKPKDFPKLKSSPVPAHESVVVSLSQDTPSISSWKLINQMGQVLRIGSKEASDFVIERKDLPGGMYWCQIRLENDGFAIGRVVFE